MQVALEYISHVNKMSYLPIILTEKRSYPRSVDDKTAGTSEKKNTCMLVIENNIHTSCTDLACKSLGNKVATLHQLKTERS